MKEIEYNGPTIPKGLDKEELKIKALEAVDYLKYFIVMHQRYEDAAALRDLQRKLETQFDMRITRKSEIENAYENYMNVNQNVMAQVRKDYEAMPKLEWVESLSKDEWVAWQEGDLEELESLAKYKIKVSRRKDYYFTVGTEVMLDVDVMTKNQLFEYKKLIGVKGRVKDVQGQTGMKGRGKFNHKILFEDGLEIPNESIGRFQDIPIELFIEYDEETTK